MRQLVFTSFALIVLMFFLESCAPVLTSPALRPAGPHVVFLGNDTIYARSVVVKDRFRAPEVIIDDKTFGKSGLLYAHTNWGHRYYVVHNRMMEQIVSGRIDVFSNGRNLRQNKPWTINDSGLHTVKTVRLDYLRKLPSGEFLRPHNPTLLALVSDYEPARRRMHKAQTMRYSAIASIVAGSLLTGVGCVAVLMGALDHKNPDSDALLTSGLCSVAAGSLTFSIALPVFLLQQRRFRVMAVETYNRGF